MMNRLLALVLALVLCLFALPAAYADSGENQVITMEYAPDAYLPTIEEVFQMHIQKALWGDEISSFSTGSRSAGAQLTGDTKKVYDALVPYIQQIAAGSRASTIITLGRTLNDTMSYEEQTFTVEKVVELSEKLSQSNLNQLTDALLADYPYEMYWYNKSQGAGVSIVQTDSGSMLAILFTPAGAYAANESYTIDTTKAGAAAKAAENAVTVVNANTSKSDYEKLVAYRNYICGAVSYNDAAADDKNNTPYGDPWQLIYVFDGNEDTNVVCEGYAKAFQYLCDMTVFDSEEISCYTVSGQMNGGKGAGGHMWNIVTMDDGKNYLVDVTNCDSGTIGYSDGLFLKGYDRTVTYSYTDGTTQDAYRFDFNYSSVDFLYDFDLPWGSSVLTISQTDYTPGTSHTCSFSWVEGNDKTEAYHILSCSSCSETQEAPHTVESEATCQAAAVCSVCGSYGDKNANNHASIEFTYAVNLSDSAKHDKKRLCCGAVTETETHNWVYKADGDTITAKCQYCPADDGQLMLSAPSDLTYSGSAKEAVMESTLSGVAPVIVYTGNVTNEKPVNAGEYTASVTLAGEKASVEYTISKKKVTVTAQDQTVSVGEAINTNAYTVDGLVSGHQLTAALSANTAAATENGTIAINDIVIKSGEEDVTANYDVTAVAGKLVVKVHEHDWTYTASGNTITAACTGCTTDGGKVMISAPSDLVYSGSAKEAQLYSTIPDVYPDVKYSGNLTDKKPVNAGSYTASITLGDQTVSVKYTVMQKALRPTVVLEETDYTYDGTSKSPSVTVMDGDVVVEPYEYNVYCENNIKAGTAIIRVEDRNSGGNYALDPVVVEFIIKPAELTDDMVSLAADSMVYTGVELKPAVTVSSPAAATDYDVSYSNNTAVGTATVTVTGKNNYTGTVTKTFKITAHEHSWTYSASGNTITATCSGEGNCEVAGKTVTLTVTGGTHEYDGTVKQASVTQNPADTFPGVTAAYDVQPLDAGKYTASITLGGMTATDTLTINPKPVNPTVVMDNAVFTYDGTEKKPAVTVKVGDTVLDSSEYSVTYANNTNAGTATATVSDAEGGNYALTQTPATFTINAAQLTADMVSLSVDSMVYTGGELKPDVTVGSLTLGTDYTVAYSSNVNIGTAKVTVTGAGNYAGKVEKSFRITKHEHSWTYSVSGNTITAVCGGEGSCEAGNTATVTIKGGTYVYNGTPKAASVVQVPENMFTNVTVRYQIDTTTYNDPPVDAGTYTVIAALDNVTAETTLTISPKEITPVVELTETTYAYDGYPKYPEAIVKDDSTVLTENDYWIDYGDNTSVGQSPVTVNPRGGNYKFDPVTVYFTITGIPLTDDMVKLHVDSMVYTGSALTPGVTVTGLVKGTDYTVAYENNVQIGTATVTVTGIGNYAGTVTKTFAIKAHEHDWAYSVSGNVITATCSGAGSCDAGKTATVTITGGTYTYDGAAKQATVTQDPANTFGGVQMVYPDNKLPVNAGNYTVGVTLGGVTATDTLTIERKPITPTVKVVEPINPRVYNGNAWSPTVWVYDGAMRLDAGEYLVYCDNNVNAGTAIVTVKNYGGGNYLLTETTATFTIHPATLTDEMVSLPASAVEYTGSPLTPAVTVSSPATAADYDVSYSNNTAVGTATVTVTGKNNYTGTVTKTFEITTHVHNWTYSASGNVITAACACTTEGNKVTVTVTGGTYTYDGTVKQATVTQDPAGVFTGVAATYDVQPKNAGTYTATIELGGETATAQIVISPKPVTVTADAKSKAYGDADPALTYQADGLVTGEALTGALAREAGENAGEYAINQGTLTDANNPNYAITFTGAKLTIAKKPAAAAPTVMGAYALSGNTYTYTVNPIEGAEYRMDDDAWQDSNVFTGIAPNSTHTFSARIKGSENAETGEEGKTAQITFDRLQGAAAVSITGWTYGQTANIPVPVSETNDTDNVTYLYESTDGKNYSSASAPTNAGSYKVTATFAATDAYSACTATAEFTIAKAIPTPAEVTGLKASCGDTLSSVALPDGWAWKDGSVTIGSAGSSSFDAVYTPADTANYELLTTKLTVTVDPKAVTADFSAVAGSYPFTGQEIRPTVTVADGGNAVAPSEYTVTYSNNVNVGKAKITVTDVDGGNYIVTGEKEFEIVKAAAPAVQETSVAVLREIDTTGNEVDLAALLPLNRGETAYSITTSDANAAVKNAAVSAQGKFTFDTAKSDAASEATCVIKAVMQNYEDALITVKIRLTDKTPVTVSGAAAASGLTYDGTAKAGYTGTPSAAPYTGTFDVTYTGTQADGTAYGPTAEAPVNAGSYTATIAVPASAVYAGSTAISFDIAKAAVTVKVNDLNALVGQEMPELSYEVLGLVGADELITKPTLSCTPNMSEEGEYQITASGAEAGANYTITYQAGTLFVVMGNANVVTAQIVAQGLTQVAAGLANTEFNTVEKIKEEQTRALIEGRPGYTEENMAHYDVKLQFSLDGGNTWIDATEVNFPIGGIEVSMDYPEGTSGDTHDFVVSHMFTVTNTEWGTVAGETEQPDVTETPTGLKFTVSGLSPVSVAWKETKGVQEAIDSLPKTGDASMVALWSLLCLVALIGSSMTSRRRDY